MSQQQYSGQVGVYVYMTIDISGSMDGAKIDQASVAMQEIFDTTPDHVNFTIQVFNRSVRPFFVGNSSATGNLAQDIKSMCNGGTALFDAVGQIVSNIPPNICSSQYVQLIVLTDGEDNASNHFTHASMTALVKQKAMANPNFTVNFFQVGQPTSVFQSLQNIIPPSQSNVMNVANSSSGVKTAMASAQRNIMMSSSRVNAIRSGGSSQVGPPAVANKMPTIHSGVPAATGTGGSSIKPITIPSVASVPKSSSASKSGTGPAIPSVRLPSTTASGTGQKHSSSRPSNSSQPVQPVKIPQNVSASATSTRQMTSLTSGIQAIKLPPSAATASSSRKPSSNSTTSAQSVPSVRIPSAAFPNNSSTRK